VRPETTQCNGPELHTQVCPPEPEATTVYAVIGAPPFEDGADHDTVADPFDATAVTPIGGPGVVSTTSLTAEEELPTLFVSPP
jgi:hypothetical protein